MANPEHLEILNQGVDVWNKWREDNSMIRPDLTHEDFSSMDLSEANFSFTDFSDANLKGANLYDADLCGALMWVTNFNTAILQDANLSSATITGAELSNANLHHANLFQSTLRYTKCVATNFTQCVIIGTVFDDCVLSQSDFGDSFFGNATIADCDLSLSKGLEITTHRIPSSIGIDTIYKSGDNIPEVFLRGCGVPETFIAYAKFLVDSPIEYYSCFISFTEKDNAFSERLYNDMQAKGIRCWHWKENAKWGRTLRKEIEAAIHYYDKLVVICSKDSLKAPAVLEEIERALDKEDAQRRGGDEGEVLFPIAIDRYIFDEWEHELKIRLMRKNIGDFCSWNGDPEKYRMSVERLVRDLNRPRK